MKKKHLKCCGNCFYQNIFDDICKIDKKLIVKGYEYCKNWEFDKMPRKNRKRMAVWT
jgi:hypothetical protein